MQVKLLRVLQEREVRPVGAAKPHKIDVRVISASHRKLEDEVTAGRFREDLFYRLNVVGLQLPSLAERREDIAPLALHFMRSLSQRYAKSLTAFAPGALELLGTASWPGNVRQLQNVIFRAAAICEGNLVDIGDLDIAGTSVARGQDGDVASLEQAVGDFERELLQRLYASYPSTRQLAGRLQTSHTAIAQRLRKYGIPGRS